MRVRRSADLTRIGEFARTLSYTGLRVLMPAVLVVLVAGVWLVFVEGSGNFTQLWVLLALAASAVAFLVGAVYLSRSAIQLERVVSAPSPDVRAAVDALGRWLVGYGLVLAARSAAVALAVLVVFGLVTDARPVFSHRELDCGSGYYAKGVTIMAGVYQCRPRAELPSGVQPRQIVTTQDEVGLYLARLQVRVFHMDFVQGTYHWLALGVPFSE